MESVVFINFNLDPLTIYFINPGCYLKGGVSVKTETFSEDTTRHRID